MSNNKTIITVAIVETTVCGVKAYQARCTDCTWKSKPFDHQQHAIAIAKKHTSHLQGLGEVKGLLDNISEGLNEALIQLTKGQ